MILGILPVYKCPTFHLFFIRALSALICVHLWLIFLATDYLQVHFLGAGDQHHLVVVIE